MIDIYKYLPITKGINQKDKKLIIEICNFYKFKYINSNNELFVEEKELSSIIKVYKDSIKYRNNFNILYSVSETAKLFSLTDGPIREYARKNIFNKVIFNERKLYFLCSEINQIKESTKKIYSIKKLTELINTTSNLSIKFIKYKKLNICKHPLNNEKSISIEDISAFLKESEIFLSEFIIDEKWIAADEENSILKENLSKFEIVKLCEKLGCDFYLKDNKVFLETKNLIRIKNCVNNIKDYRDNQDLYIHSTEACRILKCTNDKIRMYIRKYGFEDIAIIDSKYFIKKEELYQKLDFDKKYTNVVDIAEKHKITQILLRKYIKRLNIETVEHPFSKLRCLSHNNEDYVIKEITKTKNPKLDKDVLQEYSLKNNKVYIDSNKLDSMYATCNLRKKVHRSDVNRKTAEICNRLDLEYFFTDDRRNILVEEKYLENIEYYYYIYYSGEYVKRAEVNRLLSSTKASEGIIKYCKDTRYIGEVPYFLKSEIENFKNEKERGIPLISIAKELNVEARKLINFAKKNDFEVLTEKQYPLRTVVEIDRRYVNNLKEMFVQNQLIKSDTSKEGKFQLGIVTAKNISIIHDTYILFEQYRLNRFNKLKTDDIVRKIVSLHNNIIVFLKKEIFNYNDDALKSLYKLIKSEEVKIEFIKFVNYCFFKTKGIQYKLSTEVKKNNEEDRKPVKPYKLDKWFAIGKMIFEDLEINKYVHEAIIKRTNAMVLLYIGMHFCCSWRSLDLIEKLPRPNLEAIFGVTGEKFFKYINYGKNFTTEIGQLVCNDVINKLEMYNAKHSKNDGVRRLSIDRTMVKNIGFLLAVCEAHLDISKSKGKRKIVDSLITSTVDHKKYHDFLGAEYKRIFGDRLFSNRRANKSYMEYISRVSHNKGWGNGYMIASLERGHKMDEKEIAVATQEYMLPDPEFINSVMNNLYRRGTFGFVYNELLNIIENEIIKEEKCSSDYKGILDNKRTEGIELVKNVSCITIDKIVKNFNETKYLVKRLVKEMLTQNNVHASEILNELAQGNLSGKTDYCQCILKITSYEACIHPYSDSCNGCDYLVPEMYFLLEFNVSFKAIVEVLQNTTDEFEKERLSYMITKKYLPLLDVAIKEFGIDRVNTFINIEWLNKSIFKLINEKKLFLGEV